MENAHSATAHNDEHSFDTKVIWRTFWILLVITCMELTVGMFIAPRYPHHIKIWFNVLYIILTGAKAFYIIAEFMHLRHEIKNLIMTIGVPALLFLWFIGAFLWDGNSYKNLRNNYDRNHLEQSKQKVEEKEPGKPAQKPGALD